MHIGLDASDLLQDRIDGTTVYARELLPRLSGELLHRGHTVTAFVPRLPGVPFPAGVQIHIVPGRRFWTQISLSRALFRVRPDLLFLPIQTVPLYRPSSLKTVATVHDLDFLTFPRMYTWKHRLLLRWFTRVVARNATRLLAISSTTKNALIAQYQRNADAIDVVYHGIDHALFHVPQHEEDIRETERVRSQYHIPAKTLLFVGALQPRKNILHLLHAFEILRTQGRVEHLVLVTGNSWKDDDIWDRIQHSSAREAIHVLPRVPLSDLPALYWNAAVFILPSFSEGFGLPVLEAMACSTPVVLSRTPALEEVAGDAAIVVNPHQGEDIAEGILHLLTDTHAQEIFRERGKKRAEQFSWERTVRETADVIERAGSTSS